MREDLILFTGPMVRAIRTGTKRQTRRVCKPTRDLGIGCELAPNELAGEVNGGDFRNAKYAPGDRLAVRETFFAFGRWETCFSAKKGRDEWHFVDMTAECGHAYWYAADGDPRMPVQGKRSGGVTPGWWKRPAIFMPRAAGRLTLEISAVRVERLQSISEADARAEGITDGGCLNCGEPEPCGCAAPAPDARDSYIQLWESINGAGSWDANPWVWTVTFEVLP